MVTVAADCGSGRPAAAVRDTMMKRVGRESPSPR
jgi:hypothetical protein